MTKTLKKSQYELIANAFKWAKGYNAKTESAMAYTDMQVGYQRVVTQLADLFALQNSKFDRQKFIKSCGVEEDLLSR